MNSNTVVSKPVELPPTSEKTIQKIRKERLDDPAKDIERLKKEGLLTPENIAGLEEHFQYDDAAVRRLFAEAFAIKNAVQETHYAFIHAQSTSWMLLTYFIKELVRKKSPKIDVRQYKFLRCPGTVGEPDPNGIKTYKHNPKVCDDDKKARMQLLSVDAYFYNQRGGESSYSYVKGDTNVLKPEAMKGIVQKTIRQIYSEISECDAELISREITKKNFPQLAKAQCGNLFVLCIPKENLDAVQYRAHPFGVPCKCHNEEEDRAILDKLQTGTNDRETQCEFGYAPQYRLYTPELSPGEGKWVYFLSSLPKSARKSIKAKIKSLVDRIEQSIMKEESILLDQIPHLLDRLA